jgi:hypothetical protein
VLERLDVQNLNWAMITSLFSGRFAQSVKDVYPLLKILKACPYQRRKECWRYGR